jgi:hypothetical protein
VRAFFYELYSLFLIPFPITITTGQHGPSQRNFAQHFYKKTMIIKKLVERRSLSAESSLRRPIQAAIGIFFTKLFLATSIRLFILMPPSYRILKLSPSNDDLGIVCELTLSYLGRDVNKLSDAGEHAYTGNEADDYLRTES